MINHKRLFKDLLKYDNILFLLNDNYINKKLISYLYKDLYNYNNNIIYVSDVYSYVIKSEDENIFFIDNFTNKKDFQFNKLYNDKIILISHDNKVLNNYIMRSTDLIISSPFEDDFLILKDRYNFLYYNDFFEYLNSLRKNINRQEKIKSLEIF